MQPRADTTRWTSATDLRSQIQKLWDRGEILSGLVTGEALFPKRLMLRGPSSAEMIDRFEEVRTWINELQKMPHCRLKMRHFKHRLFGENAVPDEVWIDNNDDAFALIDKRRDVARFLMLIEMTRNRYPELLGWITKRPLRVLELFDDWERLLDVVGWVKNHPRPGVYLRQVDIPGVHSKFLEGYLGLLSELLEIVLPPGTIDVAASGVSQFARRYGFLEKPLRVRFRILDPDYAILPSGLMQDLTLEAGSFARLNPRVSRVFITENEINFLAFPEVEDSLLIFGAGYGFETLTTAHWLSRCRIYYWGDIDTHGFAILDQLRGVWGDVSSFLMDRTTLMNHRTLWGQEDQQTIRDLSRLNKEELELYDDLRDNRIRKNLRLEQERIGFSQIESFLFSLNQKP
jgi:hypothetical protein